MILRGVKIIHFLDLSIFCSVTLFKFPLSVYQRVQSYIYLTDRIFLNIGRLLAVSFILSNNRQVVGLKPRVFLKLKVAFGAFRVNIYIFVKLKKASFVNY